MRILQLKCKTCNGPFSHIVNGVFIAESRHEGHIHTNAISLALLLKLAEISKVADGPGMIEQQAAQGLDIIQPKLWDTGQWALPLRCFRSDCDAPWAHLVDGTIQIMSWHYREKHDNQIAFDVLKILTGG
jgi:hypothetical protein